MCAGLTTPTLPAWPCSPVALKLGPCEKTTTSFSPSLLHVSLKVQRLTAPLALGICFPSLENVVWLWQDIMTSMLLCWICNMHFHGFQNRLPVNKHS